MRVQPESRGTSPREQVLATAFGVLFGQVVAIDGTSFSLAMCCQWNPFVGQAVGPVRNEYAPCDADSLIVRLIKLQEHELNPLLERIPQGKLYPPHLEQALLAHYSINTLTR